MRFQLEFHLRNLLKFLCVILRTCPRQILPVNQVFSHRCNHPELHLGSLLENQLASLLASLQTSRLSNRRTILPWSLAPILLGIRADSLLGNH